MCLNCIESTRKKKHNLYRMKYTLQLQC